MPSIASQRPANLSKKETILQQECSHGFVIGEGTQFLSPARKSNNFLQLRASVLCLRIAEKIKGKNPLSHPSLNIKPHPYWSRY